MSNIKIKGERLKVKGLLYLLSIFIFQFSLPACSPEAKWYTDDVEITMDVHTVSAGFVECHFTTSKDAYYLVACEEVRDDYNPLEHQKAFMTLALDSANVEYLAWRNSLLKKGEFNIAPFSSHALQYGNVNFFFTGLLPDMDYWIYAFVVNPDKMTPAGKLYLQRVTTKDESIMDVHFDYRIKGLWDYIYPVDTTGTICDKFPYIARTVDSLTIAQDSIFPNDPKLYFMGWALNCFLDKSQAHVLYGVHAAENDGWSTETAFEEGNTYYTAISGYDGSFKQLTIYKFTWTGDSCNYFFHDTDSANIVLQANP
ncbi:MAG: hypothetical protein IKQ11_01235 [Paludibacteraceae bacterium]|nr:hypothetical protein [Paludibacteraceae bacterium]